MIIRSSEIYEVGLGMRAHARWIGVKQYLSLSTDIWRKINSYTARFNNDYRILSLADDTDFEIVDVSDNDVRFCYGV